MISLTKAIFIKGLSMRDFSSNEYITNGLNTQLSDLFHDISLTKAVIKNIWRGNFDQKLTINSDILSNELLSSYF